MNPQPIDRLDEIAAKVGARVPALIIDLRDQIMEAITAATEESQDEAETTQHGKRAVLSIPISVKWDLSEMSVSVEASVSVKTKAKATIELSDPNQPELLDADGDAKIEREFVRRVTEAGGTLTVGGSHE
jgi:hypothetical protein